jgi:hypothetical protein
LADCLSLARFVPPSLSPRRVAMDADESEYARVAWGEKKSWPAAAEGRKGMEVCVWNFPARSAPSGSVGLGSPTCGAYPRRVGRWAQLVGHGGGERVAASASSFPALKEAESQSWPHPQRQVSGGNFATVPSWVKKRPVATRIFSALFALERLCTAAGESPLARNRGPRACI